MLITLKKALKLRTAMEGYLSRFEAITTMTTSAFEVVEESRLDSAMEEMRWRIQVFLDISRVLRSLRTAIDTKNSSVSIPSIQADISHHERMISLYKKISEAPVRPSSSALAGEMDVVRRRLENDSYAGTQITFSILTPTSILHANNLLLEYRRSREELEDKRAEVNSTNHVEISEDDAAVLLTAGLL